MPHIQNDSDIKIQIEQILKKVAEINKIQCYETKIEINEQHGEGFLGEVFFGSIRDKASNKIVPVAIKKAFGSTEFKKRVDLSDLYTAENYFYSSVFPTLNEFQKQKLTSEVFNYIPKYYFGSNQSFNETVVMEDIRHLGFKLLDSNKSLELDDMKHIFQVYAKFHALTLSFKQQHPKEYAEMCLRIEGHLMLKNNDLERGINSMVKNLSNNFSSSEIDGVNEKLEKLSATASDDFRKAYLHHGEYSTMIHGNSRVNNMMFKYDNAGKLKDIKIFDFQTVRTGTPIHDLSYIFYDGGSKEIYPKLHELLDAYYETFSRFASQLGSNPEEIFPKNVLLEDWKRCAKCGFFVALIHARLKNMDNTKIVESMTSNVKDFDKRYKLLRQNSSPAEKDEYFISKARSLLYHAMEYDIL